MVRAADWPGFGCGDPSNVATGPDSGVIATTPYGATVTLSDTPWNPKVLTLPANTVGVWIWCAQNTLRVSVDQNPAQAGESLYSTTSEPSSLFTLGATIRPAQDFYLAIDQDTLTHTLRLMSGDPFAKVELNILVA